ncbi:phospholipase A1 member A isoform X2 [Electrophorus electricus]|uniref:phospholipase A1 member A isoform X2 n=1 Tax=Electrophorus electricus TaxID=8005 RepID=UPI0015CFFBA8|nr:phospholipase A1 member A isoform X2 [Electrophorus electricus]
MWNVHRTYNQGGIEPFLTHRVCTAAFPWVSILGEMACDWLKVCTLLYLCASPVVVSAEDVVVVCADIKTSCQDHSPGIKVHVRYLLLTRQNTQCASLFTHDHLNITQQHTAHFNSTLPTKVIVHGYRAPASKPSWINNLTEALLRVEDANVLVADWVCGASLAYNKAVENYKEVSFQIFTLIKQLKNQGSTLESFHIIGISLGAHVAGFVGTLFKGKLGRITGLDPAGPMFKNADPSDRLDPSDALFVEAIHTDSDKFGISIPVGHVDFFLNDVYGYLICDHMRAIYVYMSALDGSCSLTGFPCSSYEGFLAGQCTSCENTPSGTCPQIGLLKNSGIKVSPLPKYEKVYLLTTSDAPFCTHHILIELKVSQLEKSAEVQFNLVSTGGAETGQKLLLKPHKTVYKMVVGHPEYLCKINSVQMKNTGILFYRQGDIHIEYFCISEVPSSRKMYPLCVENINVQRKAPWSHDYVQVC